MMRLNPESDTLRDQIVTSPWISLRPANAPRPNDALIAVMVVTASELPAAITRPNLIALTTMTIFASTTMSGLAVPCASMIEPQQMRIASIHITPSSHCSRKRARLWRPYANNMGLTRSTPEAELLHHRTQLIGSDA